MKIAVIAANGLSGQAFVRAALSEGHSVNAGVHSSNPFISAPGLRVIKIDASNQEDLGRLISGQDCVVCLIGHGQGTKRDIQTDAITKTIKVMEKHKIKRLVSLTGTGVRFKKDKITFIDYFLNSSIKIIDYYRIKDGRDHVEIIKKSKLDWTIIRVLKLTNKKQGYFSLSEHGPAKLLTSRNEVAKAILEVLDNKSYIKKAPIISKP